MMRKFSDRAEEAPWPIISSSSSCSAPMCGTTASGRTRNDGRCTGGVTIQDSTYYLTGPLDARQASENEPLHQFIPLVEFAFDTPRGEKTAAMNSGLAYVGGYLAISRRRDSTTGRAHDWRTGTSLPIPRRSHSCSTCEAMSQMRSATRSAISLLVGK
jgi:hypothetical protein